MKIDMKSSTPEEYKRWLLEQTENCLRESNQTIDATMAATIETATQDYLTVLERLAASRKKVVDEPEEEH